MRKTTNYGLVLYDAEDKMSITSSENSLNATMEIIDETLKGKATINDMTTYIEEHKEELKGADGQNGKDGTNGVSATHSWNGTTLTVTSASGTSSANLKGEKGDKGDQGIQGIQGEKGIKGDTGAKGDKGDTGSAGKDGANGKSAYEYAKDGGYTGTEEEFATALAEVTGSETITVLSDNIFDKSTAITGKTFYHSSSGPSITDSTQCFYAYVPLQGAGTYRTKVNKAGHGESYAKRVPILKADKSFLQNVTGTVTATDNDMAYNLEFTITEDMINNGAAIYAFDGATAYLNTLMIVKDREYPSSYIPYGYIEVEVDDATPVNILTGKTAVFFGDSLCAGTTVGDDSEYYGYGWGGLIGEANNMIWKNYGKNGAVVSTSITETNRYIGNQVDSAYSEYPNADYVIFDGGANDSSYLKDGGLGTFSSSGYSGDDYSDFTKSLESLILKILKTFPNAKVGYIIPQKIAPSNDYGSENNNYRKFFDRAAEICEKWGIPYIDLWKTCPLNPKLSIHYDSNLSEAESIAQGKFYTDGSHLTLAGYKRLAPKIEAFMRTL